MLHYGNKSYTILRLIEWCFRPRFWTVLLYWAGEKFRYEKPWRKINRSNLLVSSSACYHCTTDASYYLWKKLVSYVWTQRKLLLYSWCITIAYSISEILSHILLYSVTWLKHNKHINMCVIMWFVCVCVCVCLSKCVVLVTSHCIACPVTLYHLPVILYYLSRLFVLTVMSHCIACHIAVYCVCHFI